MVVTVGTGTSISTTTVPSEVYVEVLAEDPVQVTVFVIVDVGTSISTVAVPPGDAV